MIITFFLLGKEQKKEKKFLLYAILPTLIAFPLLITIVTVIMMSDNPDTLLNNSIIQTAGEALNKLIDISFLWMILSFSRLLFRRFSEQRQRIREQELEKEQIVRQQELERMKMIELQKLELETQVTERTAELKRSIEELKATQNQLIQAEKMASLGEMTAGIAHEIQNPLNFVNNFADVNAELVDEINGEIDTASIDPGVREKLSVLLGDMKKNQQKIREHGKRADSIVKNMLQHSRTSSEKKEPIKINPLVDEYVKLSYHGLRARDKSFNAHFETHLDPAIKEAEVLPQDFGRVVLNLVNNAFYAVNERFKTGEKNYKPSVTVKTKAENGSLRLTVSDNGNGISEGIREKIFQPFFTTKPTGEGTGLGLSISYEIITKGHGGKMWVESKEGEGSSFIVEIPA
jgi:signal transduction histidine kinase